VPIWIHQTYPDGGSSAVTSFGALADIDLSMFPTQETFAVSLDDTETFGKHLCFTDGAGKELTCFPWWDNCETELTGYLQEKDRIIGTREEPFHDMEQCWEFLLFEKDGFVYVLATEEETSNEFTEWYRVPSNVYHRAWDVFWEEQKK